MSKDVYEVYICKYNDEVVYVGEGAYNRHKHCNSGTSHVYELNKLHFTGFNDLFDVKVTYVDTKEKASKLEKKLIDKYKPKFNKVGLSNERGEKGQKRAEFKKLLIETVESFEITDSQRNKLLKCIGQFMRFHSHEMLQEDGLKLQRHNVYRSIGFVELGSAVNNMKYGSMSERTIPYIFKNTLEIVYEKHFGKFSAVELL